MSHTISTNVSERIRDGDHRTIAQLGVCAVKIGVVGIWRKLYLMGWCLELIFFRTESSLVSVSNGERSILKWKPVGVRTCAVARIVTECRSHMVRMPSTCRDPLRRANHYSIFGIQTHATPLFLTSNSEHFHSILVTGIWSTKSNFLHRCRWPSQQSYDVRDQCFDFYRTLPKH